MIWPHLRPFAAVAILLCAPVAASAATDPSALCLSAARRAAAETGAPLRILLALTLTETGRAGPDGMLTPWPWTLNKGGEGLWFDSRQAALTHLETVLAAGTTNVDVGCFQLNYRWHGQAFASLTGMLDPETNAVYAARLVLRLYQDSGDWGAAVAAYHSSTPAYAERYLARFKPIYAALGDGSPPSESAIPRENRFPLLLAGATRGAGSLVPLSDTASPLIGGP